MKISYIVIMLSFIILTGCTTLTTVMESWRGHNIDDVSASWGAPSSVIQRRDGGATYTWTELSSNRYGVHQCRKNFVTDRSGTIVSYSYNGCRWLQRAW